MIARRALLLLVGLGLLAAASARADDIPADKRALIMLRVLAYDRNLAERAGEVITIAVVYRIGDVASEKLAGDLVAAIGAAERSVGGRPVRATAMKFSVETLERDLGRASATAVYVCPGLSGEVGRIAATTRKGSILSFAQEEESVKQGLSIGLLRRGDRVAIMVNLEAARAESASLAAELLRLAEVVKR